MGRSKKKRRVLLKNNEETESPATIFLMREIIEMQTSLINLTKDISKRNWDRTDLTIRFLENKMFLVDDLMKNLEKKVNTAKLWIESIQKPLPDD